MAKRSAVKSADIAERGLRCGKEQLEQVFGQAEDFVRKNPARSVGYAVLAGFVLNRLPVGRILGGFIRLSLVAFKPAILAYGAARLYQAAQSDRD